MSVMARQPERGYRGFVDWSNDCVIDPGFLIGGYDISWIPV